MKGKEQMRSFIIKIDDFQFDQFLEEVRNRGRSERLMKLLLLMGTLKKN